MMEEIGNSVLNFFGSVLLPLLLPFILLGILLGMRNPQRFVDEIFGLIEAVLSSMVKMTFALVKMALRALTEHVQRQSANKPASTPPGNYPRKP